MPKAVLTFKLPEEQSEYKLASSSAVLAAIIYDWTNFCRHKYKYSEEKSIDHDQLYSDWWKLLNEYNYDPFGE